MHGNSKQMKRDALRQSELCFVLPHRFRLIFQNFHYRYAGERGSAPKNVNISMKASSYVTSGRKMCFEGLIRRESVEIG